MELFVHLPETVKHKTLVIKQVHSVRSLQTTAELPNISNLVANFAPQTSSWAAGHAVLRAGCRAFERERS